jgi:hypothetical protein
MPFALDFIRSTRDLMPFALDFIRSTRDLMPFALDFIFFTFDKALPTFDFNLDLTLETILDFALSINFCFTFLAAIFIAILEPAATNPAAPPVDAIAATFAATLTIFIIFLNLRSLLSKWLLCSMVVFMLLHVTADNDKNNP